MEFKTFIENLEANGQHYVPIVDSNIYAPNPNNASDAYEPWTRGAEQGLYIRDPSGDFYYGDNWPGFSTWGDYLLNETYSWWSDELVTFHNRTPFSGIWIDRASIPALTSVMQSKHSTDISL